MLLTLREITSTNNSTLSGLWIDGRWHCFVIEDGPRDTKVPGETRIPGGLFNIEQRREGRFFEEYKQKFKHEWVPWLRAVPNFEFILIHIGNFVNDTRGCLLVNYGASRAATGNWAGSQSTAAYLALYKRMDAAFKRGEAVSIEVIRNT